MLNKNILKARLGIFDKTYYEQSDANTNEMRLQQAGGNLQQERMIRGKQQSLDRALWFSYQAAQVKLVDSDQVYRALINPNKLKQDYDDKIISIHYSSGYKPGDVFEWVNTNTYWLIYLQELTELAYFRGDIRKCSYIIKWLDDNGIEKQTYAAIRGPVETQIDSNLKHNILIDSPNLTVHLLIPKNEDTLSYFRRYSEFYISGLDEGDQKICWRVTATDSISTPGILEFTAREYYANEFEDDIENGVVGALVVDPIDPNPPGDPILGETFIKPKKEYTYTCGSGGEWTWDKKTPIEIINKTASEITLKWLPPMSGQFDLKCGEVTKTIVVESLF